MITKKTLFILGAGASVPYGYPTGQELRKLLFTKSPTRLEQSQMFDGVDGGHYLDEIKVFSHDFEKASDYMIDYFLATRPDHSRIGKIAIYNELLFCENNHGLRESSKDLSDDWMSLLYNEMTSGINNQDKYKDFSQKNNVSFITFNYDRVLEYFFWESLKHKYNLTDEASNELVVGLNIHHVFGRLPPFEHVTVHKGVNKFPYQGFGKIGPHYQDAIQRIKILHEREKTDAERISRLIGDAERIFFLGFGFAEENVALLNLKDNIRHKIDIYCTSFGLSKSKQAKIKWTLAYAIKKHFKNGEIRAVDNIFMFPGKSKKLLEEQITPPPQEQQSPDH